MFSGARVETREDFRQRQINAEVRDGNACVILELLLNVRAAGIRRQLTGNNADAARA